MKPVDIFIGSYLRPEYTQNTLLYLDNRTKYPHRTFLLDNGGNQINKELVDYYISFSKNMGIHALWNVALSLAESEYFITSDNDIYVPDLDSYIEVKSEDGKESMLVQTGIATGDDWLTKLVKYMDQRPDYGAISLHPHVFIGIAGEDPNDPEDVKEAPMCGAVMRIMRTEAVRQVGGWEHKIDPKRNHEERTICSRLQTAGYKVGRTTRLRAYHPFGDNWGYPEDVTPEMQGHNPQLKDYVKSFDHMESYDNDTWLPK